MPVYLAEVSPYEKRGSLVTRNEVMIVSGQFAAFVINAIIFNVWGEHEQRVALHARWSPYSPRSPCSSECCGCRRARVG